jgi:DNA-binding XRE family transcriptional regulator
MTAEERELRKELRLTREHLIRAIELSKHYDIHRKLEQAFIKIENAHVWFEQEHK